MGFAQAHCVHWPHAMAERNRGRPMTDITLQSHLKIAKAVDRNRMD